MANNTSAPSRAESGGFELWHLIMFFFGLTWPGMFYVLVQTYIREVTGSAADAGLVMAMIGLGALATPVFGGLADRYQAHRPIQILSFSMVTVGMLVMTFAENEMFFVLAAILVGIGLAPAATMTTVYAVGAGLSKEAEAKVMASTQRMAFAGQIVGGFAIAGLLQLQEQGQLSYEAIFLICTGVIVLALLLSIFATRDIAARVSEHAVRRAEQAVKDAPPGKFSLGDLFKSTFGLTLLVIFLNHIGWIGMTGQYVNFLDGAFGVDRSITSSVNSIAVLLSLVVIGFAGKWMGSAGPVPVLSAGILGRAALALVLAAIGWMLGGASGAIVLPLLVWVALRLINPFTEMANPVLAARTAVGGGRSGPGDNGGRLRPGYFSRQHSGRAAGRKCRLAGFALANRYLLLAGLFGDALRHSPPPAGRGQSAGPGTADGGARFGNLIRSAKLALHSDGGRYVSAARNRRMYIRQIPVTVG